MVIEQKERQVETREILDGFLYSYRQLDTNSVKLFEASASLYALIELLTAKGLISRDELDQYKKAVKEQLNASFKEAQIGVRVRRDEINKYDLSTAVNVDCASRIHLCHGACCSFEYPLTMQDIKEGVRWSLGRPFMNAHGADGYCVHWERDCARCSIYESRPAVCRQYDCSHDKRVWLDFDKMIINPDLFVKTTNLPEGNRGN